MRRTVLLTFERFPDAVGTFAGAFDQPNVSAWVGYHAPRVHGLAQDGTVLPAGVPLFHEHAFRQDGSLNKPDPDRAEGREA